MRRRPRGHFAWVCRRAWPASPLAYTDKQTAALLELSSETVRSYVKPLFRRVGVNKRVGLLLVIERST